MKCAEKSNQLDSNSNEWNNKLYQQEIAINLLSSVHLCRCIWALCICSLFILIPVIVFWLWGWFFLYLYCFTLLFCCCCLYSIHLKILTSMHPPNQRSIQSEQQLQIAEKTHTTNSLKFKTNKRQTEQQTGHYTPSLLLMFSTRNSTKQNWKLPNNNNKWKISGEKMCARIHYTK